MSLPVAKVYHVPSDSNPSKRWEVLERTDGFLSCSCPVWVFNKRKTEPRSCKHTEQVKGGLIESTTIYQETLIERTREAQAIVERTRQAEDHARRNATALGKFLGDGSYTSPREQEVMGRGRRRRVREAESPVDQNEASARKLTREKQILQKIKERMEQESPMQVFPTKRKVNW